MNPLTNMKNQQKMNERELSLGLTGTQSSWHKLYEDSAWVFTGGLPYELTEGDVICIFSQYGEIVNINLVRDKDTGKSKGYAFICYEDQRSTILAVDNLNGARVLNRAIRVDHKHNYQVPKDRPDEDDLTKQLREGGCAPVLGGDGQDVLPLDSDKHMKKKKKKKDKKKKAKSEPFDGSNEASASHDERPAFHDMKREAVDDYTATTRTDSTRFSRQDNRFPHPTDIIIKQERQSSSPEVSARKHQAEVNRVKHEYRCDTFEHRKSRSDIYDSRVSSKSESGSRSPHRSNKSPSRRDHHSSRIQHAEHQQRARGDRDRSNSNPRYNHHSRGRDYDKDVDRHSSRNKLKTDSHHDSRRYK